MKSLKLIVMISTHSPFIYVGFINDGDVSGYTHFLFYCNNFANFFVYFWIDDKFRDWILRRQ